MINWQPFVKGDEVWIYYVGGDGEPSPSRAPAAPLTLLLPAAVAPGPFHGYRTNQLMLAKIQRDGFAGYRAAPSAAGAATVLTQNVTVTGATLLVSADARAGSVSAGVVGGGAVSMSAPIAGRQVVDAPVRFGGGADLGGLVGASVRLNFTVSGGAVAFAFAFSA